jgi:UDP-N-acetylmuramate dehydrogenase
VQILRDEPLGKHCRFHIGGPADYFCEVHDADQLNEAVNFARSYSLRFFIYSGGSNLFFDDLGYRGLVIRFVNGGYNISKDRRRVSVSAGYDLPELVRYLGAEGLGGLEFLGNIPGSVGGAVVGNAGCYGKELASFMINASVYDTVTGEIQQSEPEFFEFDYRHSKLKYDGRYIVVSATLRVEERPAVLIFKEVEDELKSRLAKHPHNAWCGGSFFKNPSRETPAWYLIRESGLDQESVGGATLSARHANFLINSGDAFSRDVIELVQKVQRIVKQKTGVELQPEVRYVGPEGLEEIP